MSNGNIKLTGICKKIKSKNILSNVNIEINSGEFVTILGPSGAGKTTVLRIIAGFDNPTQGLVSLNGKDITKIPSNKRNIGMLFQNYALFPHMTVAENVAFPLKIRKMSRSDIEDKVKAALDMVKLSDLAERLPKELSGGQQQRAAMARSLVFNPSVLLLDEPMAALDKQLRKYMQLEIKQLHNELGITTISVTHDQEEALTMATKVCVLRNGSVEQISNPRSIYDKPKNTFIASFIGETNIIETTILERNGADYKVRLFGKYDLYFKNENYLYPVGEKIYISIRPEKFNIVEGDYEGFKIKGTVTQSIFVGEALKIKVRVADDAEIDAKVFITSGMSINVGDTVYLSVNNGDIVTLRE